jgi:hypothetical protein
MWFQLAFAWLMFWDILESYLNVSIILLISYLPQKSLLLLEKFPLKIQEENLTVPISNYGFRR